MHLTFIHPDYNHELLADNAWFATKFQRFNDSIMEEIERAVVYGHCDAYTIRNLLQPLFPDQLFLTQRSFKCHSKDQTWQKGYWIWRVSIAKIPSQETKRWTYNGCLTINKCG